VILLPVQTPCFRDKFPCSPAIFETGLPEGLDFKHENSPTPRKHLIENMGGGIALLTATTTAYLSSGLSAEPQHQFDNPQRGTCENQGVELLPVFLV